MSSKVSVVILAAGQGTRMKSTRAKVLHRVGGEAMLAHVLGVAGSLSPESLHVVIGHGGEQVRAAFRDDRILWHEQAQQLGTGHALAQALPHIPQDAQVLVLYGDVPLLRDNTLQALLKTLKPGGVALLSVELEDPAGYGRIIRDEAEQLLRIVEERDASVAERQVREVNTGIMTAAREDFARWLAAIGNDNTQGEYYLTDCIGIAVQEGRAADAVICRDRDEVLGINDRRQLAYCERVYQRRVAERLMLDGVTLMDPARLDVRGTVEVGADVTIDVNVVLQGEVRIESGVTIGANCHISDSRIGAGTEILPNSVMEDATVGRDCRIGPYARIRPGTVLDDNVHLGNFVEVKKSFIDRQSKVNHLSYIGDSRIGKRVNVGAGTITCNYDGANKHQTVIGDDAFIGSDTQLVAPVTVGRGATIGAGSTITHDTPQDELTLSRARQTTIPGWRRPRKGEGR